MKFVLALVVSYLITYVVTPHLINLANKCGFVDQPTKRKKHDHAVPLSGGLAMYLSFVVCFAFFVGLNDIKNIAILIGSILIMSIGILDDYYKTKGKEFGVMPRVVMQIIPAVILYCVGIRFTGFMNPINNTYFVLPAYLQFSLTILWVFGVITVINFSDGLDGLAGGFTCISATTLFIVAMCKGQMTSAMLSMLLIGISLGFLKYNAHPAKIFMGDSGATFLGYMLAVISLHGAFKQATLISVFIPVLALGVPIFDNIFVVIKRFIHHKPVYKPDSSQIHYRLLASGMSINQAVRYLFLLNICLNLTSIIILLLKI